MDCVGSYIYLDGNIITVDGRDEIVSGDVSFYEVIRTRDGVPLFFDDHMKRLEDGIMTRYSISSDIAEEVRRGLNALISHERHNEINVRVTVTFAGKDRSLHICYIHSSYPSDEMVREGVHLILYHAERPDPGVKMLNTSLRLAVNEELIRRQAYEALLVNSGGYITEGSRSNIFFITGSGIIHTAPDSMVLPGITRSYVTEIVGNEGIPLVFGAVKESSLDSYRSAFITGTSPMVLAVRSVEGKLFDVSDPIIRRLREVYNGLAEHSILDYRKKNNT